MKTVALLLNILIFFNITPAHGSDFYVGAMPNLGAGEIRLYITTPSPTIVNFTVETGTGYMVSNSVTNSNPAFLYLPSSVVTTDSSYSNRNKGIHVYSQVAGEDISVVLMHYSRYSIGEYSTYPHQSFPINQYKYYVVSTGTLAIGALSQVLLVGNEDNTTVTIVATQPLNLPQDVQSSVSGTIFVPAGSAYTFTLHKLQTFFFGSAIDLTGTSIVSDKPLTVVSGHECGNVPQSVTYCEHITEQIPPTITWGKQFLLTPYANLTAGPYYKIIAAERRTIVSFTCGLSTNKAYLYNSGDFTTLYSKSSYCSLISNKPVLVNQLAPGGTINKDLGDPVISVIPPIDQYSTSITFAVLGNISNLLHFINIALTTKDTILLDGQPVSVKWNEILNHNNDIIGYGTQIQMPNNLTSHVITTQSNNKFSLLVYGFGRHGGYSYSAGVNINQLVKNPLHISPWYGNIMGGVPITVSGPSFKKVDQISLQFDDVVVDCIYVNSIRALCVSPFLSKTGKVTVRLYHYNELYDSSTTYYSIPMEDDAKVEVTSPNDILTSGDSITVTWSPSKLLETEVIAVDSSNLTVDVIMYEVQTTSQGNYVQHEIAVLASDIPNNGKATITIPSIEIFDTTPVHSVNIIVNLSNRSLRNRRAIGDTLVDVAQKIGQWSINMFLMRPRFAIPFYLACKAWALLEPASIGPELLDRVTQTAPCPRTLGRNRRIPENSGLVEDKHKFLIKIFHPDADKCFRQQPETITSENQGTGNQCCYYKDGTLIVGSPSGGSVDKTAPTGTGINYLKTFLLHQAQDVIPYIVCCKGLIKDCQTYYDRRPSDDGSSYNPPVPARAFGDPHIVTLDLFKYTFNGKGEFILIKTNDDSFTLQGRMIEANDSNRNRALGTVFSAIVAKQNDSDTIQFELTTDIKLIVLVNGEETSFEDIKSQRFNNVTVTYNDNNTFSATFSSGAYLKVQESNGFIAVLIVGLPERYKGMTNGLMGPYNGDISDDLTPRGGSPIPLNSSLQTIHEQLGLSWIITSSDESLFTYPFTKDWKSFYYPSFSPIYTISFSNSTLEKKAKEICRDDEFCLFDIAATGRVEIGEATVTDGQDFELLINLSKPIKCNPPCAHGVCVATDVCVCGEGYTGNSCNITVYTTCDYNPCENGGTCRYHAGTYFCTCREEFVGERCENEYGCKLPASSGPCTGTYPRWFFNVTSKQCEHFSYGGCYGNSNRFGTLQECINICGCPDGRSVQCSTNPCHESACPSYTNAVCEIDKCTSNSTCIAKYYVGFNEVTNICNSCELPASTGSCSGNETRWYYKSGTCQQFTYSGCGGNKNNFKTIQDCVDTCDSKCPAGVKDVYCFNDLCQVSHCPNYPEAKCVTRSCGNCTAHYYDTSGVDITALCATCPADSPPVTCLIDVCEHQNCFQFPQAQCMIDNCGSCKPKFFLNGTEVTNQCSVCPIHGQIFRTCALSCRRTCTDLILHNTVICDAACKPGCECPAGQVIDETKNKCVYPQSCPCPSCQPVSPNCTNTTTPNNHLCSCPICIDCPVKGQVYKKSNAGCPRTCTSLDILCTGDINPGCSCPDGQVIDEMKNACVPVSSCPKPNPCTFEAYKGPCNGQIQRYFHNSTSSNCEVFQYGGCYGNENNFFTKYDCEEKCSDCPPVCSQEFCSAKRNAICSIQSSPIQGTCQISNCLACYYSYTELSLPVNDCTTNCVSNGQINKSCVAKWGRCIRRAYYSTHSKIQPHERVASNFRCWSYPL